MRGEARADVAHELQARGRIRVRGPVDAILEDQVLLGERLGLAVIPRRAERVREVVREAERDVRVAREARRNASGLARDSDVALRLTYNLAHALCATGNHGEAEALAEENLILQKRVYGTSHPNAAAGLELVGHVRAGLAAQAA